MKQYVGLDVSMKATFIRIEDELGKIMYQGHSKTDPECITERLKKFQLAMEKVDIESDSINLSFGFLCHSGIKNAENGSIYAI